MLDTQVSIEQGDLSSRRDPSSLRRTLANTQPQLISKVAIRYYFHRFIQCLLISYVAFAIYVILIITTGVLIVYFTAPEKRRTLPLVSLYKQKYISFSSQYI